MHVDKIDYGNIPGCTYCLPEIASVGLTEKQAKEKGYEIKVGKFRSLLVVKLQQMVILMVL